ncbi:MAG TPA: LuxR C-terminal-related transcriptional regulator [Mycobacteriales bacterium]|nr:LuxR C-terminal-related transcriptional regulator [Mycobacteriales bacterium]
MDAQRALERLAELAGRQHDLATFWRHAAEVLTRAVPHHMSPCWYSLDPASLLLTSHFHEEMAEFPQEWLEQEYVEDDLHQIADVVRTPEGISTLHDLTGGDPSGSSRWQANMEMGGDQELLLRLRARSGDTWGALGLYRAPGVPLFSDGEKAFLKAAAVPLAEGVRRSLLFGEAQEPEWPDGPGLVVVTAAGELDSATHTARSWLALFPAGDGAALPLAVRAVAAEPPAESRVRATNGHWLTLRAARFAGEDRVAVIVEPTAPARIFDLVTVAHGLTPREREVVQLVLAGQSTTQIATGLYLSPYTVQEHLTAIFDKMGVRTRRELVAQAFFTHYAPRFRDNERRVESCRPVRGNPALPA